METSNDKSIATDPNQKKRNIATLKSIKPEEIANILKSGGVVVFPTETVYGIGASSLDHEACLRIYQIKNRPPDNPLISHFYSIEEVERFAELPNHGRILLEKFSPGPLTLVLKKKVSNQKDSHPSSVLPSSSIFSTGLETIAVRIPSHPLFRELLRILPFPVSAPSANLSGKPSITRESDAIQTFDGLVDGILLLDKENPVHHIPHVGLESTVLDISQVEPQLLRPGSIERGALEDVLGFRVSIPSHPKLISPGVKYKHYSPVAKVKIFSIQEVNPMGFHPANVTIRDKSTLLEDLGAELKTNPKAKIAIISFQKNIIDSWENRNISKWEFIQTNEEYASRLYSFFIDCDKEKVDTIYCEYPKEGNLSDAILNRLEKASNG